MVSSMRSNLIFLICTTGVLVLSWAVDSEEVRGTPGFDYPNYHSIPRTSFKCSEQRYIPGFYADLETQCQAFHFCFKDNQESFLCPIGTTFNQQKLICDVWFRSNCSIAPMYYGVNSGPAMRNAARKLPMFLKLRNRSQAKLPVPSSTAVYETIASLFEKSSENIASADKPLSTYEDSERKVAGNSKITKDSATEVAQELSGSGKHTHGETNLQYEEDGSLVEEKEPENIVYDPAQSGYDKSDAGWTDAASVEAGSFYSYDTNDGYEEILSDGTPMYESRMEFLKRHLQPGQFTERVRRRPTYVVVPEDGDEFTSDAGKSRGIRSPHQSSESTGAESTDDNTTEAETPNPEPFPRPTAIPHHLLGYSTEVPMTSEEFEAAIMRELVVPGMTEAELNAGPILASTYPEHANLTTPFPQPAASYEESQGDAANMQGDEFVYVDDSVTEDEETDQTMYTWRRPTYVMVSEDGEALTLGRPRRSPDESESQTASPEPFPRPTAIPHHLLEYSTEVPMTSEEFGAAIMRELVVPGMTEAELNAGPILASTYPEHANLTTPFPQPAASYEESRGEAANMQDDQFVYVDEDYETDQSAYRWRRPTYVLVPAAESKPGRPRRSPDESESQTASPEPFPRPTAIPHHLLEYSTEVPMTSEEFGAAIMRELVVPGMTEAELNAGPILASTYPEHANLTTPFPQPAASYEESQGDAANVQGDQFVYMDDHDQPVYRWRRPTYVVVPAAESKPGRPRRSPDESESQTASPEPFPRPTAIPHHLLEYSTEVPMTSEEFGAAIMRELVVPGMTEAELNAGPILASTYPEHANLTTPFPQPAASYEASQGDAANMQGDEFVYVDDSVTEDEETDQTMHTWRRPTYVMVSEDGEALTLGRPRRSPDESESQTASPEPFPRPTAIPHHLLGYSTEVPMTSEEFEAAIMRELVVPGMTEAELNAGPILASTYPEHANLTTPFPGSAAAYEESQASSDMQSDQYAYVDDSAQEHVDGSLYGYRHVQESYPSNTVTGYEYETPVDSIVIPDENDSERELYETELVIDAGDQSLPNDVYKDEYRYYKSRFPAPQMGSKVVYPGRWPAQFQYYPGMRPEVQFPVRIPYIRGKAPLTGEEENIVPQMNGMYDHYNDQNIYPGSPAYQQYEPLNYDHFYEHETPFAYGDRYSNPYVPIREEMLHYSIPGYESEYQDVDSHGVMQTENEILVTSPLPITDSDLLKPSSEADFVGQGISGRDEQSEETYIVLDDEEQISEQDEAAEMENTADVIRLNATDAEKLKASGDQSLQSATSENENIQSDSFQHGTQTASNLRTGDSEQLVKQSSTFDSLAAMKTSDSSGASGKTSFDSNAQFNKMSLPESMDFGPYGYGASMGQQYGMMDSMHGSKTSNKFAHRKGEDDQSNLSKLSALQERIRSMKQGKFGVFKKYLSTSKDQK